MTCGEEDSLDVLSFSSFLAAVEDETALEGVPALPTMAMLSTTGLFTAAWMKRAPYMIVG